jgi:hypothetical protein
MSDIKETSLIVLFTKKRERQKAAKRFRNIRLHCIKVFESYWVNKIRKHPSSRIYIADGKCKKEIIQVLNDEGITNPLITGKAKNRLIIEALALSYLDLDNFRRIIMAYPLEERDEILRFLNLPFPPDEFEMRQERCWNDPEEWPKGYVCFVGVAFEGCHKPGGSEHPDLITQYIREHPRLIKYIRRGDLIHNMVRPNYRNEGYTIWDGEQAIELDRKDDKYGSIPPQFETFTEFPFGYFNVAHNDIHRVNFGPFVDEIKKNKTIIEEHIVSFFTFEEKRYGILAHVEGDDYNDDLETLPTWHSADGYFISHMENDVGWQDVYEYFVKHDVIGFLCRCEI